MESEDKIVIKDFLYEENKIKKTSIRELFRYITGVHKFILILGIITALAGGIANTSKYFAFVHALKGIGPNKSRDDIAGKYYILLIPYLSKSINSS